MIAYTRELWGCDGSGHLAILRVATTDLVNKSCNRIRARPAARACVLCVWVGGGYWVCGLGLEAKKELSECCEAKCVCDALTT